MNRLDYTSDDYGAFRDIAAPWNVIAKLDKCGAPLYPMLLPESKPNSLSSFLRSFIASDSPDPRVTVLSEIWNDIESNGYYIALTKNNSYNRARIKFEKQLRQMVRSKALYEVIDKRIMFTYITGEQIYVRSMISLPTRLEPDKPTARSAIVHVNALLEAHRGSLGPLFTDYELHTHLMKLRAKLTSVLESRRVENTMSADNLFVFMLARAFIAAFGRTMPTVISDLCPVVGYEPDRSTIERWINKAKEHSLGKDETS